MVSRKPVLFFDVQAHGNRILTNLTFLDRIGNLVEKVISGVQKKCQNNYRSFSSLPLNFGVLFVTISRLQAAFI